MGIFVPSHSLHMSVCVFVCGVNGQHTHTKYVEDGSKGDTLEYEDARSAASCFYFIV